MVGVLHRKYRGSSLIRNRTPSDAAVGLCLELYGSLGGEAVSYERDTPVLPACAAWLQASTACPGRCSAGESVVFEFPLPCHLGLASERRGNNSNGLKDFFLNAKAKIWP